MIALLLAAVAGLSVAGMLLGLARYRRETTLPDDLAVARRLGMGPATTRAVAVSAPQRG